MIDLEQFKHLNPAEVSDENMNYFREELLKMHDELVDAWMEEVKKYDTENFDPYSFSGSRILKKLAKKHSKKVAEVDLLIEVIDDEMAMRENYREEQRYLGNKKFSPDENFDKEEYLKREQEKTEKIRKIYSEDDEDD